MSSNLTIVLATTLLLTCAGCSSTTTPSGEPSHSAATTSPAAPEYKVGCDGTVTPLDAPLDLELEPKCVGGAPGTKCGDEDPCAPQEATFSYVQPAMRCSSTVYVWDGAACSPHETSGVDGSLRCAGTGCAALFDDEASCKAAFTTCTTE